MLIKRKSIEQAESSRRPASAPAAVKPSRKPKFAPVTLSEQGDGRHATVFAAGAWEEKVKDLNV